MKKYIFQLLLICYSTTLLAQSSGPLTAPQGTRQGVITMVIVFAVVFLIGFLLYKRKRTEEKK